MIIKLIFQIIHDKDKVIIQYSLSPKLLATSVGQFDNKAVYKNYFGGVVSLTWKQFEHINGYPNRLNKVFNLNSNMFAGSEPPKFCESPNISLTKYQLLCLLFAEKIDSLLVNQQKISQFKLFED